MATRKHAAAWQSAQNWPAVTKAAIGITAADRKAAPSPETTLLYERIRRGDDV